MIEAIVSQDVPLDIEHPPKTKPLFHIVLCLLEAVHSDWVQMEKIFRWLDTNRFNRINVPPLLLLPTRFLNVLASSLLFIESQMTRVEHSGATRVFMTLGEHEAFATSTVQALHAFDFIFLQVLRNPTLDTSALTLSKDQLVRRSFALITTAPSTVVNCLPDITRNLNMIHPEEPQADLNGYEVPFRLDEAGNVVNTRWMDAVTTIVDETTSALKQVLSGSVDLNSVDEAGLLSRLANYLKFSHNTHQLLKSIAARENQLLWKTLDSSLFQFKRFATLLLPVFSAHLETCPLRQPSSHLASPSSVPQSDDTCANHIVLLDCLHFSLLQLESALAIGNEDIPAFLSSLEFHPDAPPTIADLVSPLTRIICQHIPGSADSVQSAMRVLVFLTFLTPTASTKMIRTNLVATVLRSFDRNVSSSIETIRLFLRDVVPHLLSIGTGLTHPLEDAEQKAVALRDCKLLVYAPLAEFIASIHPLLFSPSLASGTAPTLADAVTQILSASISYIQFIPGIAASLQPAKPATTVLSLVTRMMSDARLSTLINNISLGQQGFGRSTAEGMEEWKRFAIWFDDDGFQDVYECFISNKTRTGLHIFQPHYPNLFGTNWENKS
ncbi:hypothetical protein BLNAU_20543 [Blattamonas nauphoetae]|uniref:Uncharacterized protein n=1 Tax=Blattamonas nauphoetae TaxID=2049346 RepID=A0ABQ9WYF1_9EUKA|nr:hypothetical protein BLNAU_20543 [Blattamonas nauphoetae]